MSDAPLRVVIVGAGNIAGPYGAELVADRLIGVAGVTDLEADRARALAEKLGCATYPSLQAALADPAVDAVVTLTALRLHAEVSRSVGYSPRGDAVDRDGTLGRNHLDLHTAGSHGLDTIVSVS